MPLEAFGLFLILAALLITVLAFVAVRGGRTPETFSAALLLLGVALAAYGHGIELFNDRQDGMMLGRGMYLLGWGLIAPSFLAMALRFAGDPSVAEPRRVAILFGVPMVLALGGATNGYHHLFYRVVWVERVADTVRLAVEPAFFHWLNALTLMGYGAIAIWTLLRSRAGLARHHRAMASYLALAGLPPLIAGVFHLLGWRILGVINPLPFVLALDGAFLFAVVTRRDFLDLRPLARDVLMEQLPDGILVIDGRGVIVDHNAEAVRLLDLRPPILGRSANEVLSTLPRVAARIASDSHAEFELHGRIIELRSARIAKGKGRSAGLILQIHDSTEARRTERALAVSLRRESQLGALGRAVSVTHRLEEIPVVALPLIGAILEADSCSIHLHAEGVTIANAWSPARGVSEDGGRNVLAANGDSRALTLMLDPRGQSVGALSAVRDRPFEESDAAVAETVRWLLTNALANALLMLDMERAARTDALTGLDNRASFVEAGEREVSLAARHGRPLCLAVCDLDHFKDINDRYGHAVGDAVLVEASRRIAGSTRATDLVARWGGEEFAILMPEADLSAGRVAAERVRQNMGEQPFVIDGRSMTVTISIGVATLDREGGEWLGALTERADRALYSAKNAGRNRVAFDRG
jgi:diguanylate cyclase (GGDEF)-like protein